MTPLHCKAIHPYIPFFKKIFFPSFLGFCRKIPIEKIPVENSNIKTFEKEQITGCY